MASCWVEINLDAIRANYQAIRAFIGPETDIIAVVKANAYGHGAIEVARALAEEGAKMLAVTRVEEAIPLRQAGIQTPILLLAPAPPDELEAIVEHNLTACLSAYEDAERLSIAARNRRAQSTLCAAHLKINTGMGRLGCEPEDAVELARRIAQLPGLQLQAAWTHFSDAAETRARAVSLQYGKFQPLIHHISRALEISPKAFHCANSSALLRFPSLQLSCVRPGTLLYGQFPSSIVAQVAGQYDFKLRDTFKVKARIVAIQHLKPGQSVGYGGEWTAPRPSRIATIAVGFADGLSQRPQTRYEAPVESIKRSLKDSARSVAQMAGARGEDAGRKVLWRGEMAYLVGRIAMQESSIDVTHLPNAQVGDEVEVSMRRTSAGAHLPRVYA